MSRDFCVCEQVMLCSEVYVYLCVEFLGTCMEVEHN